jgi:hypothetical protein
MSAGLLISFPVAKGPIPFCLDEFSRGRGARRRIERLRDAIASIAPDFRDLSAVFSDHLLVHVFKDPQVRSRIVQQLQMHWFDDSSPQAFFPNQRVAVIYAQGVLKTLELSLKGRRPIPINAWWVVDLPEVRMINLADAGSDGVTVGGRVTLLIMTPRPKGGESPRTPILGELAQAFVTAQRNGEVLTAKLDIPE